MRNISVHVDHKRKGQTDISNRFQCTNGVHISSQLLCNLENNCMDGEDEMLCERLSFEIRIASLLFKDQVLSFSHNNSVERPAYKYISCSDPEIKCIYDISDNGTQKYCQSGAHLADCGGEDVLCEGTSRCPHYYCLPFRYVCDGHWDCPLGYDEDNCVVRTMPGYYHCNSSVRYILLNNLCDDIFDCPEKDDETVCELKNTVCPTKCLCFRYSLICSNLTVQDIYESICLIFL